MLTGRALLYVGSASYSLYLWQQLFLNPTSASWAATFPANIVVALAVGLLARHLIEGPLSTRVPGWSTRVGALHAACASRLASGRAFALLRSTSPRTAFDAPFGSGAQRVRRPATLRHDHADLLAPDVSSITDWPRALPRYGATGSATNASQRPSGLTARRLMFFTPGIVATGSHSPSSPV
jgi:hypothetical protein